MAYAVDAARTSTEPAVQTELARIHDRIASLSKRADDVRTRLLSFLGRAVGPRPEETSKNGPRPVAIGAIGSLDEALDALENLLSDTSEHVARLSNIA